MGERRTVIYAPEAGDDLDWIYKAVADAGSHVIADRCDQRILMFCERLE